MTMWFICVTHTNQWLSRNLQAWQAQHPIFLTICPSVYPWIDPHTASLFPTPGLTGMASVPDKIEKQHGPQDAIERGVGDEETGVVADGPDQVLQVRQDEEVGVTGPRRRADEHSTCGQQVGSRRVGRKKQAGWQVRWEGVRAWSGEPVITCTHVTPTLGRAPHCPSALPGIPPSLQPDSVAGQRPVDAPDPGVRLPGCPQLPLQWAAAALCKEICWFLSRHHVCWTQPKPCTEPLFPCHRVPEPETPLSSKGT